MEEGGLNPPSFNLYRFKAVLPCTRWMLSFFAFLASHVSGNVAEVVLAPRRAVTSKFRLFEAESFRISFRALEFFLCSPLKFFQ